MLPLARLLIVQAAQSIVARGGWCIVERCVDIPHQRWEARILIFHSVADAVAEAVEEEIAHEPEHDARLIGCDRRTLRPNAVMGTHLVYLSDVPALCASPSSPSREVGTS